MSTLDTFRFRCSSLDKLMTEPKLAEEKKAGKIGATARGEARKLWAAHKWNRQKMIENKYTKKGNLCEEDAITLLSSHVKELLFKNEKRLSNNRIAGTPDTYIGRSIEDADETFDTKCCYDVFTFEDAKQEDSSTYEFQGRGYMELTGAKKHHVAYCLVNNDFGEIKNLLYRESFKWKNAEIPVWEQIRIVMQHIFDKANFDKCLFENDINVNFDESSQAMYNSFIEIPAKERIHIVTIEKDPLITAKMYTQLDKCLEYVKTL